MAGVKKIKSRMIHKSGNIVNEEIFETENVEKNAEEYIGIKKIKAKKIRQLPNINETAVGSRNEKIATKVETGKKIKTRRIRMSLTNVEEKKMDAAIEREDNMSIVVMIVILLVCFVVGISLGYLLYKIAINGAL